ncbi:hypothetical protein NBT05_12445 [Aquimarina sp. ERC-38]|uniref:hypothetical protein n=1 Tax=Aquimarina sp. ERC-38 TaxID=2949996 RepID=UPI00224626CF|nr:hypothetical protein [Aquimarina sp. ERC-38]UZO79758.1 hypothetical protein NBT05_12445 [Aquimarina sp. ERC-38]
MPAQKFENKEQAEISEISENIKSLKEKRCLERIKLGLLALGAIATFCLLRQPESILNRKLSLETISRERAKLVLQVIQTNKGNNEDILIELDVIEKSYPLNNDWIKNMIEIYKRRNRFDIFKTLSIPYLDSSRLKELDTLINLQKISEKALLDKVLISKDDKLNQFEYAEFKTEYRDSINLAWKVNPNSSVQVDTFSVEQNTIDRKINQKIHLIQSYIDSIKFNNSY